MIDLDEAIKAAAAHAVEHGTAVVVSRDGQHLASVVPDTLILELIANGTPLSTGGEVMRRPDGRSVLVF